MAIEIGPPTEPMHVEWAVITHVQQRVATDRNAFSGAGSDERVDEAQRRSDPTPTAGRDHGSDVHARVPRDSKHHIESKGSIQREAT